ncbi:MAG: T9SS type A sorting domain-containing protein [Flavobacteriales bacterium]
MKFFSFLFLFFVFANTVSAQTNQYSHTLDSIITTNNDTSSYIKILGLYTKQEYSYDSAQNTITELFYGRDTALNNWTLEYKTDLFYNEANQLIYDVAYDYLTVPNQWTKSYASRHFYCYDGRDSITVFYDWWNAGSLRWDKVDSTSFSYDSNNDLTSSTICGTYDTTVNCVIWNTQQFSHSGNVTTINSYDQQMNFEGKDEIYFDNYNNDTLVLSFDYNAAVTDKSISLYNYAVNSNNIRSPYKHVITRMQTEYREFSYKNSEWLNTKNSQWYYSANPDYTSNNVGESIVNKSNYSVVSIYPNPMLNESTVRTETQIEEGKLELYDMTGSLVYSRNFSGNTIKINKDNLPSGVYSLIIIEKGIGVIHPCKLVVQ